MYLQEAIKSIVKSRVFSIIILIQLTISFLTLISGISLLSGSLSQLYKFTSVFDKKTTINISQMVTSNYDQLDDKKEEKLIDYYNTLLKDNNIIKMGISWNSSMRMELMDLGNITDGKLVGNTNPIFLDENFYQYIKELRLIAGRSFVEADFNKDEDELIPIIISDELKQYIPLESTMLGKYKVIGILEKNNSLFYTNTGILYSGVTQKENTIIVPVNLKNRKEITLGICSNMMITLKDEGLIDNYIKKINEELLNICGVPFRINKVSEKQIEFINYVKGGIIASFSLAFILVIFSFMGIMGIILTSLIRRKKEFGVKFSFGWTIQDIYRQVTVEIFVLTLSAYILASIISMELFKDSIFKVNIETYVILLVIVMIFAIAYSILPVSKIKKIKIVELIKDVR